MQRLTVLYDADCALCTRFRDWLAAQPQLVPVDLVPAGSPLARARLPELDHEATLQEVTAVADTGEVYVGAYAWVMCLWATAEHRALAERLARPAWLPIARMSAYAAAGLRGALSIAPEGGGYAGGCDGTCPDPVPSR